MRLLACLFLTACTATGGVPPAYVAPQWHLIELNAAPVTVPVTIDLSVAGRLSGRAPCNRYSGGYDGTLPEMRPGPVVSTEMACDALALEGAFFRALATVNRAEVMADRLILTGTGTQMIFVRPVE